MIRLSDLGKAFGDQKVLDGVSCTFQRGECVALVGAGGSGKSLLLKMLCGLMQPDHGQVLVDDVDIHRAGGDEVEKLRSLFGVLFQSYALFDFMTVEDNVAFPLEQLGSFSREEILERVESRLKEVDLLRAREQLPRELSGGMKRRVSLARATITNAPIMIYDDPTAGLDPVTSSKIFRLIKMLHDPERTLSIVVSHDVDRLEGVCSRYVLLHGGSVYFDGAREDADVSGDKVINTFFQGRGLGGGA